MMNLKQAIDIFIDRGFVETTNNTGKIYDPDKWRESVYVISKWLEDLKEGKSIDIISREKAVQQIQSHGVGCFDPDEFSKGYVIDLINKVDPINIENL